MCTLTRRTQAFKAVGLANLADHPDLVTVDAAHHIHSSVPPWISSSGNEPNAEPSQAPAPPAGEALQRGAGPTEFIPTAADGPSSIVYDLLFDGTALAVVLKPALRAFANNVCAYIAHTFVEHSRYTEYRTKDRYYMTHITRQHRHVEQAHIHRHATII